MAVAGAGYSLSKMIISDMEYGMSYSLDRECKSSKSNQSIAIDECAGMDTILLTVN